MDRILWQNPRVLIQYGAVEGAEGRWVPAVWINGSIIDTWGAGENDPRVARDVAHRRALETAGRYHGDWAITIVARRGK